ncbi:MAG: ion channel [Pseudomonadales bacterium]|nr:ion channel [Pseudomonadales bacterium]
MKVIRPLSFQGLLTSFILLLFLPGLFYGDYSAILSKILFTVILASSLYAVASDRKDLIIGVCLALPTLLTNWLPITFQSETYQLFFYAAFQAVFLAYIASKIMRYLMSARKIDSEMIYAAICLYLLVGLVWAVTYFAVVLLDPNAIGLVLSIDRVTVLNAPVVLQELVYFSYVTQTTLGYGDISPVSGVARAIVISQSLFGQIYIAVIVARLVGLQVATADN